MCSARRPGAVRASDTTVHVAEGETAEPIRGPAAALVDYMERSRDIPTATSFRTVAVDILDARRRQINSALAASGSPAKVSFTHLIGYAIARAAAASPAMTTHFARTDDGKPARVPGPPHLGLAVDSVRKDGSRSLVVPVIRDAAQRPFNDFRDEYERLIERARTNTLLGRRAAGRDAHAHESRWHRHRRVGAATDAGSGNHRRGRRHRIPGRMAHRRGGQPPRSRHRQGHDDDQHLRPSGHPGRRVR